MRGFILFIALICLAVSLCVNRDFKQTENGEAVRWSVGLFFSPLMVFERTNEYREGKLVTSRDRGEAKLLSWSFAAVAPGVLLLLYRHRLGTNPSPSKAESFVRNELGE
jgi:hypothetical protein